MTPSSHCTAKLRARSLPAGLATIATLIVAVPGCVELSTRTSSDTPVTIAEPRVEQPAVTADRPAELPGLHNVVTYSPGMFSGGAPVGRAGLETLRTLGVKTVVSVDGATPDVATAEELGLRYIHLPISYDRVPAERRLELAQVVANAEAPIYMHCHHGKHRSASALATALVTAGVLSQQEAGERMQTSGTSAGYRGLWGSLSECTAVSRSELAADITDTSRFPAVANVTGLVATMAELDVLFDDIEYSKDENWNTPADHPDFVPANATQRVHELFAALLEDPESQALPASYQTQLRAAIDQSKQLDAAVRRKDLPRANELYEQMAQGCKACHKTYRNQ